MNVPNWSVRPAIIDDADGIAAVHVRAWQEAYAHMLPADRLAVLSIEQFADRWRTGSALLAGDPEVFVATRDERVVGFTVASRYPADDRPRTTELNALNILASEYGSGVGQALLTAAIGDEPAFLRVFQDNSRAISFYRRNAFEVKSESTYTLLGTELPDYCMVR